LVLHAPQSFAGIFAKGALHWTHWDASDPKLCVAQSEAGCLAKGAPQDTQLEPFAPMPQALHNCAAAIWIVSFSMDA
jgi:hypothetical protein